MLPWTQSLSICLCRRKRKFFTRRCCLGGIRLSACGCTGGTFCRNCVCTGSGKGSKADHCRGNTYGYEAKLGLVPTPTEPKRKKRFVNFVHWLQQGKQTDGPWGTSYGCKASLVPTESSKKDITIRREEQQDLNSDKNYSKRSIVIIAIVKQNAFNDR